MPTATSADFDLVASPRSEAERLRRGSHTIDINERHVKRFCGFYQLFFREITILCLDTL